ncbi:hypothetical protein H6P81_018073 [Aristolochia fimbriata]|uniref:Uncharacterized protein n=1 Tax=Aristolochia fimbriata TaxID=158543 RepID=A0AAV7E0B7_ARIFI|nr:hypothetical protein H6P81_018073 [Aristolochia fimbriata]
MDWTEDNGRYLYSNCKQPGHNKRAYKIPSVDSAESSHVVMADTQLLYDQDSHWSEAIWHGESSMVETGQTTNYLTGREMEKREEHLHMANGEMTITLEDVAFLLGLRVDNFVVIGSTRDIGWSWPEYFWGSSFHRCPRRSHGRLPGVVGVGTSAYWTSTFQEEQALQDGPLGSRWNVRWMNATNPCGNLVLYRAKLNHQRNYKLGCAQNVIERVKRREVMDPSLADPYMTEIGHYCQSIWHSLPLLEGTIVGGGL